MPQYAKKGKMNKSIWDIRLIWIYFCSYYQDGADCRLCKDSCETCTNFTSCMTCKANLILFDDQCVENCPDGHFPSDKMCYECHPMCSRCTGRNNLIF